MTSIEKILINSEEYIRKLFEGIPIPIYVWQRYDNDFILVDYNGATDRDIQGKIKKKIGIKASEFYKDNPKIIHDLNKCFIRQKNISKEIDYTVKSTQELRSLSIRYSFIPSELVLIHIEDITEKKLAKQKIIASEMKCKQLNKELEQKVKERTKELEGSEENYRNLLDNLDVGFYQVTLDGHMINLNQAHKIILGYDPSDNLKDKDVRIFWQYPEQREEYINLLFEKGSVKDYICHSLTKEGKEIIVHLNSHLIRDKEGNPTRIDGTFIDITEKFKLEQKIKESEEKYRELYEDAPNAYFSVSQNRLILSCNKSAEKLLGYSKEEFLKMNVFNLYVDDEEGIIKAKKYFQRFLKGVPIQDKELKMKKKNGETIWVSLTVKPILDKSGEVIESRSMVIDINDRKKAEQKLKESEKRYRDAYDRASFYKDLFAHDINNILQIMNSSAELISLQLTDPNQSEDIENITSIIKKQVNRGTKLVNNVRILSEFEESEIPIQSIEVYDLLLKSIEYVKKAYTERDINIQIDYPDNEINVIANELLQDVFENILINAIKYNENPNTEILIKIFKHIYENNTFYKFEFIDNGIGVHDDRKDFIFKRGNGDSKGSKGMGLGLSLVSKIIEYYNGKIWVEDKVIGDYSQGSNFILLLPEAI